MAKKPQKPRLKVVKRSKKVIPLHTKTDVYKILTESIERSKNCTEVIVIMRTHDGEFLTGYSCMKHSIGIGMCEIAKQEFINNLFK